MCGSGIASIRWIRYSRYFTPVLMEWKPLLYTGKPEWKKPIPMRQCHLYLLYMISSQWDAQEWKIDATSSSSKWHEQKSKEESHI